MAYGLERVDRRVVRSKIGFIGEGGDNEPEVNLTLFLEHVILVAG